MASKDLVNLRNLKNTFVLDVDLLDFAGALEVAFTDFSIWSCKLDHCQRGGIVFICFGNLPVLPVRHRYSDAS